MTEPRMSSKESMDHKAFLQEIISTFSLNEEELFEKIGIEVSFGQDAFPPSKQSLIKTGKRWWTHNRENINRTICASESVKYCYESSGELAIIAAVLDLVTGVVTGVSPVTVSVLIVKTGIEKVCKDIWEND